MAFSYMQHLFVLLTPLPTPHYHPTHSLIMQVQTQTEKLTREVKILQREMVSNIQWIQCKLQ